MVPEIWSTTDTTFCHSGSFFAFYPTNNRQNQNFEKMKKTSEDIIILHMCTINNNHTMYGSRDMEHGCFLPFYSPNDPENQNFEKLKKKPGDIIILHKCTKNHDHMLHCS